MPYPVASRSTALQASSSSPTDGSRTMTVTIDPTKEGNNDDTSTQGPNDGTVGVLRLRGTRNRGPRVAWDDDVVDNEHMGKKKSKICCIYHKPRPFDESSSESSSESDSDSCGGHGHSYDHHHRRRRHNHKHKPQDRGSDGERDSDPEPNAYERQPPRKEKGKP
ncbi:Type 1 phosphatases regulator YPI1 [Leucoagaricus sp. SymC.cos]|nr:Type 1 phosphatases regulator YPI1 [Leucoagaricus sp. SymC.cos]